MVYAIECFDATTRNRGTSSETGFTVMLSTRLELLTL